MKDYAHIDEHVWALLNGQVDGELSESEQQELDGLLAGSEELRGIQAELSSLNNILNEATEKSPPAYLRNAITSTVRLPIENQKVKTRRSLGTWLTEHWLGPVFALTAGVILTAGVYETSPVAVSPADTATMSGSIISIQSSQDGTLLDRLRIDKKSINGSAEVREIGQDLMIDVFLNSTQNNEFKLSFERYDLAFVGLVSQKNHILGMSMQPGAVSVESTGEQHFILKFRSTQGLPSSHDGPLMVDVLVNKNLVQQAELKTGK